MPGWLRPLALICVTMLAASFLTLTQLPVASAATSPCAQPYMFIGTAGSGESTAALAGQAGPEGDAVYKAMMASLGSAYTGKVAQTAVTYPAVSVWQAVGSGLVNGYNYTDSQSLGSSNLLSALESDATLCPDRRYILEGFSQGADVVAQVLQNLPAGGLDARLANRILGVGLMGDPRLNPADPVVVGGRSGSDQGMFGSLLIPGDGTLAPGVRPVFTGPVASRIISSCNAFDPVCGLSLTNAVACLGATAGQALVNGLLKSPPIPLPACTHLKYASTTRAADQNTTQVGQWLSLWVQRGRTDLVANVAAVGAPFAVGSPATYSVTIRNAGTGSRGGDVVVPMTMYGTDSSRLTLTGTGTGWNCSSDTCTHAGPVAAGTTMPVLTVTSTPATSTGDIQFFVYTDSSGNNTWGNRTTTIQTPVVKTGLVDLVAGVAAVGAPFAVGSKATYSVTVRNAGTGSRAGDVVVPLSMYGTDSSRLTLTGTGTGWTCTSDTCTHAGPVAAGAALPVLTVTSTPATGTGIIQFYVTTDSSGNHTWGDRTAITQTPVVNTGLVDLVAGVAAVGAPFAVGSPATYSVTIRNAGAGSRAGDVVVPLYLYGSDGSTLNITGTGTGWTCTSNTCTHAGPVAAGAALPVLTVTSTVTATTTGIAQFYVYTDSSGNHTWGNRTAITQTPVVKKSVSGVDLALLISDPGTAVPLGKAAVFTATVSNAGKSASSGTVTVSGFSGTATGTGWTCSSSSCTTTSATPAGGKLPALTISEPTTDHLSTGSIYESLSLSAASDADTGNNNPYDTLPITAPATDLALSISDPGTAVPLGKAAVFTATVSNAGKTASSGTVTVSSFSGTAAGTGWTCTASSCTTTTATPAGGKLPVLTITQPTTDSLSTGSLPQSLSLSAASDGDTSNNNPYDTLQVSAPATDLALLISDPGTAVPIGTAVVFTATVSSAGRTASSGTVTVSGFSGTATGTGWTCSASSCTTTSATPAGGKLPALTITESTTDYYPSLQEGLGLTAAADLDSANNYAVDTIQVL